jgi:hypothetical protein
VTYLPVRWFRALAVAAVAVAGVAPSASAQQSGAAELIAAARALMDDMQSDSAAALLQLAVQSESRSSPAERVRAYTLYGITQLVLGSAPAARQAFRQALILDPTLRVDTLADLHSDLLREFNGERAVVAPQEQSPARPAPSGPMVFEIEHPADTVVDFAAGTLLLTVRPVRAARFVLAITSTEESPASQLFGSPRQEIWAETTLVRDQGQLDWDFRVAGQPVALGRYLVQVTGSDSAGQGQVREERVLLLDRAPVDTQRVPDGRLEPRELVPETLTVRGGPGSRMLLSLLVAGVAAALPTALGNKEMSGETGPDARNFVAAGAVALAGLYGLISGSHIERSSEKIQENDRRRQQRVAARRAILIANREAIEGAPWHVRIERSSP